MSLTKLGPVYPERYDGITLDEALECAADICAESTLAIGHLTLLIDVIRRLQLSRDKFDAELDAEMEELRQTLLTERAPL